MSFKSSVDKAIIEESTKVLGENNHPALSLEGFGDNLVGLFFGLVRGKQEDNLKESIKSILENKNNEEIKNLFLVAFQTRWCRGGKGERKLFYVMFNELLEYNRDLCFELLELVPHYGYWKDLRAFYYYHYQIKGENEDLFNKICDILEKQLRLDIQELDNNKEGSSPKLSLLAKYYSPKRCFCVAKKQNKVVKVEEESSSVSVSDSDSVSNSEKSSSEVSLKEKVEEKKKLVITEKSRIENKFFEELATRLYNPQKNIAIRGVNYAQMTMRKKLVDLRRILDIPEVKMCANKWAEIKFGKMASLCLSRNTRAFLDEDKDGNVRHPDDEQRKICRNNLLERLVKGVNGGQLYPNELVEKVFEKNVSAGMEAVINSQWDSILLNIQEQIKKRIVETGSTNFDLSRCLVMSDVSGSMSGTPMMVSIAFGILVSQLTHPAFRDLVLTFDSSPKFFNLSDAKTFCAKVKSLGNAPWGGSTNFESAMNLITNIIESNKLNEDEIPQSLLVVSDMQFNEATKITDYSESIQYTVRGFGWSTAYDNIKNMFKKLGVRMYGHEIDPPQIIFWNVRANTVGFPAGADEEGVTLLSGYSPSLLKFIFSGELQEEVEVVDEKGETKTVKVKLSPKETLAKMLSEKALDPVREILNKYL